MIKVSRPVGAMGLPFSLLARSELPLEPCKSMDSLSQTYKQTEREPNDFFLWDDGS
jgi:hypothetical protein